MTDHLVTAAPHFWANPGAAADRPTLAWPTTASLAQAAVPAAGLERVVAARLGPTAALIAGGVLVGVGLLLSAMITAAPSMNIVVERAGQS